MSVLSFSTQFPVNREATVDDLIRVSRLWLEGSPHSKISDIACDVNSEAEFSSGLERVWIIRLEDNDNEFMGLRYRAPTDKDITWRTEIAAVKNSDIFLISVRVYRESNLPSVDLPVGRKPYFIKNVIEQMGGGVDADFSVSDKPIYFSDEEIEAASRVIFGSSKSVMPVVYVSRRSDGSIPLDIEKFAKRMSGIAHVVVEPSREFSFLLKGVTSGRNPYLGAIGIYWGFSDRPYKILPGEKEQAEQFSRKVERTIRSFAVHRRLIDECTLDYIREKWFQRKLSVAKEDGSSSIEDYVQLFDSELDEKNQKIESLQQEVARLQAAVAASEGLGSAPGASVLLSGQEDELYQGEFRDLVVDALTRFKNQCCEGGSRPDHILQSLLSSNEKVGHGAELMSGLKSLLSNYDGFNSKVKSELESYGFVVQEDGRHIKALWHGDGRYTTTLAKTPSDHRSGKNSFASIRKLIYGASRD